MSVLKYFILLLIPSGLIFNLYKPVNTIAHTSTNNDKYLNYNKKIDQIILDKLDKNKVSLLAEKSKYKLTVYYDMEPIKSYPIALGTDPVNDKLKHGDGCTPEGNFKVKAYYKHNKLNKFIWLNYPTVETWKKYGMAKQNGLLKFGDSIGSNIGLHGLPQNEDNLNIKNKNLTDGGIALKNSDINEIFDIIKVGTYIEIKK